MSDEIPVVIIGGYNRIAFDRRPPASRMARKAEGTYDDKIVFQQRTSRPTFTTPVSSRPGRKPVSTQPYHQRVRIHWRDFLGV